MGIDSDSVISHKAYARVGLLGNPSDVYYGKTISFSVANFCSTVTLGPSDEPLHDLRDHNFTPSYAINIPRQVNVWR
ncbi:probable glucuronokinase 2 [Glycine max]|uniref:probable glucuronokinase 2 n=1 Tax=Glycine max TaxID=3847 RepID=UPI000233F19C|nr:probable glucuronokinase 2 [Glycine max]|eukprot:XP_003554830.1 probable glucuronokinase 2 [Glycine max]